MRDHQASRNSLRSLTLVLTTACNLSCRYCYQDSRSRKLMAEEILYAAVSKLLQSHRSSVLLCFSGGEPLLAFDLVRRAVARAESERRPDLKAATR